MADGIILEERPSRDAGLLDRERIVARPGFNRWLVPPAALAIHLCIGMAYGFSVFWLPLTRIIGVDKSVAPPPDTGLLTMLFTTSFDWRVSDVTVLYTLFFIFLGSSAAIWGGWLERVGPRRAGVYAALCWCGGLMISALGVSMHQLWMMWLGSGRVGRHRPRARLHLARLDIDQVVPGPARHGDRDGDHGVRRRRVDRVAACGPADEPVRRRRRLARRLADAAGDGRDLSRVHAVGRVRLSRAAGQLGPRWLDAAGCQVGHDHAPQRAPAGRPQDAAILADLGSAVPQRVGRHRRAGGRLADASGDVRRQLDRRIGHAVRRAQP